MDDTRSALVSCLQLVLESLGEKPWNAMPTRAWELGRRQFLYVHGFVFELLLDAASELSGCASTVAGAAHPNCRGMTTRMNLEA